MIKKALFITYENPFTRDSGDSIYTCNILDGLDSIGSHIDIIYFNSNPKEAEINKTESFRFQKIECINFKAKNHIKFIFSIKPGMIVNRYSNVFLVQLNKMILEESYTHIFVNHLKMMYTIPLLHKIKGNAKLIYLSHNVESLLSKGLVSNKNITNSPLKQIVLWQNYLKTKFFEKKWIKYFDNVTAISEHDANFFKSEYDIQNSIILRPVFEIDINEVKENEKKINQIIIGGSFIWSPKEENLLAFLKSKNFNLLHKNGIKLFVVGRAHKTTIDRVNKEFDGVEMTGRVPDLNSYYQKAKISVVPELLGGGFKLKIIEAAITKTAIFAIKGAITECNLIKGIHFIEKDSFEELIEEIIRCQQDPSFVNELIENAYRLVIREYSKDKLENSLKKID